MSSIQRSHETRPMKIVKCLARSFVRSIHTHFLLFSLWHEYDKIFRMNTLSSRTTLIPSINTDIVDSICLQFNQKSKKPICCSCTKFLISCVMWFMRIVLHKAKTIDLLLMDILISYQQIRFIFFILILLPFFFSLARIWFFRSTNQCRTRYSIRTIPIYRSILYALYIHGMHTLTHIYKIHMGHKWYSREWANKNINDLSLSLSFFAPTTRSTFILSSQQQLVISSHFPLPCNYYYMYL